MIKNIIFDIGGVLTKFDPNDYLSPFGFDEETAKSLSTAIFKNAFWKAYMIGSLSSSQFKRAVISSNPKLRQQIEFVLDKQNTHKLLPKLEEGVSFLQKMKSQGYRIYILSNIVEDSLFYFKASFSEVCKLIDGAVYSCEAHCKKPDEQIYKMLLNKHQLKANECLFLDDSERNVESAKSLGIHGVLCQPMLHASEFEKVEEFLNKTK